MKKLTFWYFVFLINFLMFSRRVFGQETGGGSVTIENPVGFSTFGGVADQIISSLLLISVPIVAIMVLIGGFQILTAGGDPEKYKIGKKTVLYAVIGYAVVLVANGVRLILKSLLSP